MNTQKTVEPLGEHINSENIPVVLAEYNNLRAEILKRIELRHQFISLALVAPGTIIAVGITNHNVFLILSYPILACFLAGVWIANVRGTQELGIYIRDHIESKLGVKNLGWQTFNSASRRPFRFLGIFGASAIFILTEILAIFAGVTIAKFTVSEIILLVFAIVAVICTAIMLVLLERKRAELI